MKRSYSSHLPLILVVFLSLLSVQLKLKAQGCTPPNITGTIPGTRCGIGTTTLGATGDPGATLKWYAAATGGSSIGTGSVFTTPVINTTTGFYVSAASVSSGSVAIGAGANTGNAPPYNFTDGYYGGIKCQYVYTAAELTAAGLGAGNIAGLTFSLTTKGSNLSGFAVQIGTTSINAFGSSANIIGGLTTVYPSTTFVPVIGANTLNFTTPFNWNGVSNIIISISYSNNNSGNTTSTIRYDGTTNNSAQSYRNDYQTAANMAAFTGSSGSGDFKVDKNRPAFRLIGSTVCESARTAVTASVSPAPALTISPSASVCANVIKQLDVTSTLSDYDSYTWSPVSNLYTDAAATIPYTGGFATTVYYKSAGNSNQTYTVNANNSVSGCAAVATTTISTSIPIVNATASPTVICPSAAVNLSATGTSGLSWQWNPGAVNSNTALVNPANTGSTAIMATYTVTGTDPVSTCSNSAVVSVSVNPMPSSPLGVNSTQCGLGVPTASVSGGSGYKWYATPTSTAVLQTGATYTSVIGSTSTWYVSSFVGSCENTTRTAVTATVTPPDAVTATANPASICIGESSTLTATASTAAYSYTWTASPAGGSGIPTSLTGATPVITPTGAGSYQYLVTAADGVCTTTAAVTVTVKSLPVITASVSPTIVCSGAPVNLNATTNVVMTGTAGIGAGTSLTSGSWGDPTAFSCYDKFYHTQAVYTAAELTAAGLRAGNITSITYNISTVGSYSTTANYTVQCGSTTATAFTDFIPTTGYTTVYSAATRTHAVGLNTINFTTPYNWDGISNLVIDVRQDIGGAYTASTNSAKTYYTATGGNTIVHSTNNSVTSGGNPSNKRLNIIFNGQVTGKGPGSLSWQWNPGAINSNTAVVNPVNPGAVASVASYTVAGTDPASTCSNTAVVSVTVNPMPALPVAVNSTQCGLGVPTASVSGASTYKWYATPTSTAVLQAGTSATYTAGINATTTWYVSSYNANCESARTAVTASVTAPDQVTAASTSTVVCLGESFTLTAASSGTASTYNYTWTAGPAAGSGIPASVAGATTVVTPVSAGSYQYLTTASDGVCTTTAAISVNVNSLPVIIASTNPTVVCSGSPVDLKALTTANSTVATGSGTSVTADTDVLTAFCNRYPSYHMQAVYTAAELNAAGLRAGNITSISYSISTAGSANSTTNYVVKIGPTAAATLSSFLSTAGFTTVYSTATQAHAIGLNTMTFTLPYNWDGVSNLVIDVSHNGINNGSGNNARTYYTTTSAIQQVYESAGFALGTTFQRLNIRFGGQVLVQGAGGLSWQWNPGAINSNTATVNPLNTGTNPAMSSYTVTAISAAVSCSNSAVVSVSVNPLPATPLAFNSGQCGAGVSTASVSGGSAYKWYATPTSTSAVQAGTSATYTSSINATTTWYVSSYNTNCESARTAVTASVTAPDPVTASATSTLLCAGQSATLTAVATGTNNSYTYTWTATPAGGSGMPASVSSATTVVTPVTAGSFTYNVTAADGVCTATASIKVTTNAPPAITANAGSGLICSGASATLSASGTGSLNWQWNPGAINSNSTTVNPVNNGTTVSVSSYTVTGTNPATTCSATAVVSVSVNPVPAVISTTPAFRCGGGSVNLGASSDPGAVLKWYTVPSGGLSVGTGSVFATPTITATTNYYVSAGSVSSGASAMGAGASSGNSLAYNFASSFSGGSKAQYLYTAAELINAGFTAGNITGMKFNLTATGANLSGFMVQMGTTLLNTFPASADIQGGLSTVYPATTFSPVAGVNALNFPTPYNWDGVSNIIISISWSNNNTYNPASSITYDATSNYASQIYIQTNASPATMAAFTGSVAGSMSLYTSKNRPAFTLSGSLICESPRSLVTATVNTAPALTLSPSGSVCANAIKQLDVTSSLTDYDSYTWSPVSDLYTDAAATTPYTGGSATTVYYRSATNSSQVYTVNAGSSASGCAAIATTTISASMPVVNASASPSVVCSGTPVNLDATTGVVNSGTLALGAGTSVTSGSWSEPTAFNSYNADYRTQAVYTAAELTAAGLRAGNITSITYNISTLGSYSTTANYTVQCGATTATAFTDFISGAGFTTVYTAATHTHVVGLNTITFTTPYFWDGISNLVVDVSQEIGGPYTAGTTSAKTYYTQTAGNTMVYATNNNTTANGNPSNKRLNLVFNGQVASQASGSYTWQWNPGAVNSSSMAVTPTNTGTAGSSVAYTVTALDPATTCTNSAVVTLTVNPVPSVTVAASTPSLCSGTSATLTAAGAASYSWMPAGGTASVAVVSPTASVIYTLSGTSFGCTDTRTLSLSVTTTPSLNVSASPAAICAGATVSLTATGATSYTWSPLSVTTASTTITPTASAIYTVTGANMSCTHTRTLSVTVTHTPTMSLSANPPGGVICTSGGSATLTASGASTAYAWSNGPTTASTVVTPSATTIYTVSGTNGCGIVTTTMTVSVLNTPTISATTAASLICANNPVVLTASTTPGASYLWNTGATTATISVSPNGTTTYTVSGTNACGTATAVVLQIVSPCTGIEEAVNAGDISLYPNPTSGYVSIAIAASVLSDNSSLEVTDALGKLVMKELLTTEMTTVDLRKLEEGVYFFTISSHDRTVKIVKVVKW